MRSFPCYSDQTLSQDGLKLKNAVDAGAGVGRMTKLVLLRVCESVHLIEADSGWLKRAKSKTSRVEL